MNEDDTREPTPDELFNDYVENNLNFLKDLFDSKTLKFVRYDQKLDEIKTKIIDGKDVVLSNLSEPLDLELYNELSSLNILLLQMQKTYYLDHRSNEMATGIMPGLEFTYSMLIFFLLGTRAKGKERERLLITNPAHMYNRYVAQQNKPSVGEMLTGGKKKTNEGY